MLAAVSARPALLLASVYRAIVAVAHPGVERGQPRFPARVEGGKCITITDNIEREPRIFPTGVQRELDLRRRAKRVKAHAVIEIPKGETFDAATVFDHGGSRRTAFKGNKARA